jgi:hypothetical protein
LLLLRLFPAALVAANVRVLLLLLLGAAARAHAGTLRRNLI